DEIFGALPAKARLAPVPAVTMAGLGERRVVPLDVPQATISFGLPGVTREDPDFIPAFVLNHILGGGGFSSRLYQEVREKRGLAYSVSSGIAAL
ncbi:insulinase family protein, partial [Escherichia coli]|nr:insulinase family protein [Escherichia coli]